MSEIIVYEIEFKVYVLETVTYKNMQNSIAYFVDSALCTNDEMSKLHVDKMHFKNYCFSGFLEIETNKVYRQGNIYTIKLRCVGDKLAAHFKQTLPNTTTKELKGLVCTCKSIPKRLITKLYSLTPAVVSIEKGGYWRGKVGLQEYERMLIENSIKKYNALTNTKIDENFMLYSNIQFINKKPIAINYKGKKLLGDKVEIMIDSNVNAQNIAYILLATGLCTRNARGFGFVNYKFVK